MRNKERQPQIWPESIAQRKEEGKYWAKSVAFFSTPALSNPSLPVRLEQIFDRKLQMAQEAAPL
jgi:hypothetical protein